MDFCIENLCLIIKRMQINFGNATFQSLPEGLK